MYFGLVTSLYKVYCFLHIVLGIEYDNEVITFIFYWYFEGQHVGFIKHCKIKFLSEFIFM